MFPVGEIAHRSIGRGMDSCSRWLGTVVHVHIHTHVHGIIVREGGGRESDQSREHRVGS